MKRMSAPLAEHAQRPSRNFRIDVLRVGTTLLVVLHHTAITYGAIGSRDYKKVTADESLPSMLVSFCTLN